MTPASDAEPIELRWQVDERELKFAHLVSWRRDVRFRMRTGVLSNLVPALATVAAVVALLGLLRLAASGARGADWAIAGVLVSALLFAVHAWLRRRAYLRNFLENTGPLPFELCLRLDGGHLAFESPHGSSLIPLHRVGTSEERSSHVLLYLRNGQVVCIPVGAFADADARRHFLARVRAGRQRDARGT